MKILADKIPNGKNDILGRKEFANEIGKALLSYTKTNTDGITISITGEWGSGKSTLLEFIKSYLKEGENKQNIKIIEFNPWIFYKEGNIKEAFLIHFALALKDFETRKTAASKKVLDVVKKFRFLKYVSGVAGNVQESLENVFDEFSKNDSIPEIKTEIEKALLQNGDKIFILMDDIDRLAQGEILELLQTISLVMNFSNVYYIIAFDKDIVVNAICKEYGDRGQDYLEKVIQVDYSLPAIKKEKMEAIFFQYLEPLEKQYRCKFDGIVMRSLWGYHGLGEYFTTMRDFKRFFNSISFRLPLVAEEVNANDFIVIEAIRLFDNIAYNKFYSTYSINLRKRDVPEAIFKEEQLQEFKQPAADLIKALFPKSTLAALRTDTNQKRIYDSAYFERYFSLLRNDKDISEKDFQEFMIRAEVRLSILSEATQHNRVKNLLGRLTDSAIASHFPKYDYRIIQSLITFFNSNSHHFESLANDVSDAIINLLCVSKKKKSLVEKFFLSFKGHTSYPSIVHIYFFHYIRLFTKEGRQFHPRHYEFDEYYKENFGIICSWYIEAFQRSAFSLLTPRYSIECPFIKLLYLINYAELFPAEYPTQLTHIFNDPEFILYLLTQFVKLHKNNSLFVYDMGYKGRLFPDRSFIDFYNCVKSLEQFGLNDKQRALVNYFIKIDITKYPEILLPTNQELMKDL